MNIDFNMLITSDDKRALALSSRQDTVKMECRSRIYAVVDEIAQLNLAAAAAAAQLDSGQMTVYRAGLVWIAGMRAACQNIMVDPTCDPRDAASWPAVPNGVADLADQF